MERKKSEKNCYSKALDWKQEEGGDLRVVTVKPKCIREFSVNYSARKWLWNVQINPPKNYGK